MGCHAGIPDALLPEALNFWPPPCQTAAAGGQAGMRMTEAATFLETTTFLLVEDDPDDAFFVEREFKKAPANIRVRHVRDGEAAIRYLQGEDEFANRQKYPLPNVI